MRITRSYTLPRMYPYPNPNVNPNPNPNPHTPSGNVVDRATIVQHLLNDPSDPFNRAPLTVSGLVPEPELRGRIEEWLEAMRDEREAVKMSLQGV